jgi:carbon monoxide dehydrogenase subunit G
MQLEHTFTVPVPVDEAWKVLLDLPRIAPCMPGATLTGVDGETFTGTVKVKLGPVALTYQGKGHFVVRDQDARRVVIQASGKDSRSAGTASATVAGLLTDEGGTTRVDVTTDLTVTGRPAQFGRGVIADVGAKLIGQFADCLAGTLTAGPSSAPAPAPEVTPEPAAGPGVPARVTEAATEFAQRPTAPAAHPIDLIKVAGSTAAVRRLGGYALAVALVVALVGWAIRRLGR